jgi:hypothetical protein
MNVEEEEEERGCTTWKVVTAPIRTILWLTIPDCKRYHKLFPLTFIMCVAWIGSMTYVITWMITVVGEKIVRDTSLNFKINQFLQETRCGFRTVLWGSRSWRREPAFRKPFPVLS